MALFKCKTCAFFHHWQMDGEKDACAQCLLNRKVCGNKCKEVDDCNQYISRRTSETLATLAKLHTKFIGEAEEE